MDHCALDKKVDDKNFVCPHYEQILTDAFRRESTKQMYTAKSFCEVPWTVHSLEKEKYHGLNVNGSCYAREQAMDRTIELSEIDIM